MEQLREHLGVGKWLLRGGSWGVTLSLAYAERHPERVSGMVMLSVTSTRLVELDWLYRGVGRFFPEAWARFRDFACVTGSYRLPTDSTPPITGLLRGVLPDDGGPRPRYPVAGRERVAGLGGRGHIAGNQREPRRVRRPAR